MSKKESLLTILKRMVWELKDKYGRFNYKTFLLREIPGELGLALRRRVIAPYFESCGENIRIHQGVRFRNVHRISVGNNVELGVDNFLQAGGDLIIMDNAMLGPGVKIWTVNHRFAETDRPISAQGYDRQRVIIGSNAWLGANVFVMPGVELGDGCVVSAGSVVAAKKYPPYSILSGNPARVIGSRLGKPVAQP